MIKSAKSAAMRTLSIVGGVLLATCFMVSGLLITWLSLGDILARALVPPAYPNATGGCGRGGGTDSMWDQCTYRTDDSIDIVLRYYESIMPGFQQVEDTATDEIHYVNGRSNNGPLGILASWTVDDHILPSVSISISESADADVVTEIYVRVEWPAQ